MMDMDIYFENGEKFNVAIRKNFKQKKAGLLICLAIEEELTESASLIPKEL